MHKAAIGTSLMVGLLGMACSALGAAPKKPLPPYPPPVDTSAAVADEKKVEKSRSELSHAQQKLNAVVDKLKSHFEQTPDRKATVTAALKARATYDAARDRVEQILHDSAAYKAAVQERDQLAATLAASGGDSDPAQAAMQKLEAKKKVTKLETDALAADPQFESAQAKLTEVGAKMSEQMTAFQQSIASDKDWIAAKDALDKAKTEADADEKEYSAELAKDAQLQQDRAAQVAQIDRERLEQSGGKRKR